VIGTDKKKMGKAKANHAQSFPVRDHRKSGQSKPVPQEEDSSSTSGAIDAVRSSNTSQNPGQQG
ncbi:MAG: hypothetical protein ACR2NM_01100, partial [Bythopirellula sp.]